MKQYIAFLRGINVGGNSIIKMSELKALFESLEFENVRTLLNSGNVVFESSVNDNGKIQQKIESQLKKKMEREIRVIVWSMKEIQELIDANPFQDIHVTPKTRLYVTFLAQPVGELTRKVPFELGGKEYQIVHIFQRAVCSVLILSPERGSVDLMNNLAKEFGKDITTRNWNTVLKIFAQKRF